MIKVIALGKAPKPKYYKTSCRYCKSVLIFTDNEMWCDDPEHDIWRIECPICHKKIHMRDEERATVDITYLMPISQTEWELAHGDLKYGSDQPDF